MNYKNDKKCRCGNDQFIAHQIARHDIIVNANGNYQKDLGVYDAEDPYGPFTCTKCGSEYNELHDLGEKP